MKIAILALMIIMPVLPITAAPQEAHIIFYRTKTLQMGGVTATVLINETKAFRMRRGTYYNLTAHPGTYKVDLPTKAQPTLLLQLKPAETAYVEVSVFKRFFGMQGRHLTLKRVPAAMAQKRIKGLKPLPERLISPSVVSAIAAGNL